MKHFGQGTVWGIAQRLWVVIGLTLAAGCSSEAAGDLVGGAGGAGGGGGSGGFAGQANAEMVVDDREAAVRESLDQAMAIAPPVNAVACTLGSQCGTGSCVDGFCCDSKCDNKCMACSAAKKGGGADGVCGSVAYDTDPDNDCPLGACDGKNMCKNYNGFSCTAAAQCLSNYCVDGFCCGNICMGACQACSSAKKGSGSDGVCGNIGAGLNPDGECASGGTCTGSGACTTTITKLANGAACSSGAQCNSSFCADGVCCDSWCLGSCQACTAVRKNQGVDGVCGPIANDKDPDEECWGGACNGAGVCKQYNGVPCTNKSQCLSNYCVDGTCCGNLCTQQCFACSESKKGQGFDGVCGPIAAGRDLESECNPGECNGSGGCNQQQSPQANGTACVSGGQCASSNCVDGVCCDTACASNCTACTAAKKGSGADGVCGNIGSERDPDLECNGGKCDGKGVCRYYNGAPCSSTGQCFSNYCVDGFCCGNVCTGACQACSSSKKGAGFDGVCGNVANATDPDNECNPGECNGAGTCNQPQSQQPNGAACTLATQCLSGNCVDSVCCDSACAGTCIACTAAKKGQGTNGTCGVIINNTDPDNECMNADCNGSGACGTPSNLPNGSTCTGGSQCASANCIDGFCCDTACSGVCVACSAAKKGQGTNGTCGPIKYDTDPDDECFGGGCNGASGCGFYNGVNCSAATQCLSSYCVDGFCCNNHCGGTCYACSTAKKGSGFDGVCGFVNTNTDPDNECSGVCNGSGVCTTPTCSTNADCGANATCSNSACTCNSGYSGDGYNCTDIDECQFSNGGCSINATCTNIPGSRTCACNMGYTGDGVTCTSVNLVTSLFTGMKSVCAQVSDGTVKCWGENAGGSLGIGDIAARGDGAGEMAANLPMLDLGTGKTVQKLSFSGSTACAILNDNTVKCWGDNSTGALGLGDTNNRGDAAGEMGDNLPTVDLGTGKTATAITVGTGAACAILNDASVKCWGSGDFGQTGYGDTTVRGASAGEMGDNLPAIDLGPGRTATAISTFDNTTCVVLDNGSIKCWGKNTNGQLGLGDTVTRGDDAGEMGDNLIPVDLGMGKTATAVSVGGGRVCALLNDASIKCWGSNFLGALGLGDLDDRGDIPGEMGDGLPSVDLGTGKTATAIATGFAHSCALLNDSSVKCWGFNSSGQLGLGDTVNRGSASTEMGDNLLPVALGTGKTAVAIGTRGWNTCALLNDGTVKCWGQNDLGQLGQGDTLNRGDEVGEMGDTLSSVVLF